ncbi:hypothetical protein PVAND_005836 [Polypedilum vanderplanki]|uniref:SET domain-containing protein n=1 Tax=Polypedilum vanderplanki TaxID=319348 RepID=A0A9J6C1D5_POLVA|nr:hypothetical protein PVAND_005836 [Polypedilum vanderplanki]
MRLTKSDEKANLYRFEGNNFYKAKKFYDAIINYNKSLCFSEIESENLGLAYANRSAICFELRMFDKCLKNISLARAHNYPKENSEILKNREKKCLEFIARTKSSACKEFFKLSHKCHEKIPYIVNSLEMKVNEKYGRHVVTNEDLHVGDIVAIEESFCNVLLTQSKFVDVDQNNNFLRCSYCLKSNEFELIPCKSCCSSMFCKECYNKAQTRFHIYECPVIEQLLTSGSVHIALRIFFIALSAFDGSIEKLKTFMNEIDKEKSLTIFDIDVKETSNVKNYLKVLNSLTRSTTIFPLTQHEMILQSHQELSKIWNENKEFIREFLQRQCQTNDHYFHGIFGSNLNELKSTAINDLQQSIGSGWFPFCSLINHSCCSNIMRIYKDGKVAIVVSRFILKGSQLFDCYKTSFINTPKAERQLKLQSEFGFLCDCEACEGNFSILQKLPIKDLNLAKATKSLEIEMMISDNLNKNYKKFQECCRLIEEHRNKFPCVELVLLQKCFAFYLLLQARK